MPAILTFSPDETSPDSLDFDHESINSSGSLVRLETLKQELGDILYSQIKKMEDRYLKRISQLESEVENLRDTVVKPSSSPLPDKFEIKTLDDLRDGARTLDCYRDQYLKAETKVDPEARLRLHAFLAVLDDFISKGGSLQDSPERYFSSALRKVNVKINQMIAEASKDKKTLARWVNDNCH